MKLNLFRNKVSFINGQQIFSQSCFEESPRTTCLTEKAQAGVFCNDGRNLFTSLVIEIQSASSYSWWFMLLIKKIVLDVLKPHHPNSIDFTTSIAEKSPGARVELTVTEVDEKTETVVIVIEGEKLDYDTISDAVSTMGGSIHSIDKVEVENEPD